MLYDDADDNRDSHIAQLDDGTLVCTFFSWINKGERLKSYKDFNYKMVPRQHRDISGAQMVTSTRQRQNVGEEARASLHPKWVCSAPVRQLADGTCILGLYGPVEKRLTKRHSTGGSIRSTDRCKTWEPLVEMTCARRAFRSMPRPTSSS